MESGYLLRDVVNKVNGFHFGSTEEIHTLGHLYESMLKEMRDAAGDSGEFYTPRAVVRFMVAATDPQLGETVLDPACGTGGFLVEAYAHLEKQVKTVQDRRTLQTRSIFGGEAKPLPYMLAQMNLLLHGLETPNLARGNSLDVKLGEIGDKERVDLVLTNPPFGGEEERGILGNFPEDKRTAETALLFLQLIMRKLRRPRPDGTGAGRAAVVVPNGTLFGDGVCATIKEELLTQFNLHTIVRLPNGVFAPYTSIPTNLLFFDRSGPTKAVWFYEQPLPEGRKQYTKTQPMTFEELGECLTWWEKRKENEHAWKVKAEELLATGCNLDRKNPRGNIGFEGLKPEQLAEDILQKDSRFAEIMREIPTLRHQEPVVPEWPIIKLGQVLTHRKESILIDDFATYKRCRVQLHAQGIVLRDRVAGTEIKTKKQQVCKAGEFLVAEIDAKLGGYGIVPPDLEGAIVSSHYFLFGIDETKMDRRFLGYFIRTSAFYEQVAAQGSTNYAAIRPRQVLDYVMPLPGLEEQRRAIERLDLLVEADLIHREVKLELEALTRQMLNRAFLRRSD